VTSARPVRRPPPRAGKEALGSVIPFRGTLGSTVVELGRRILGQEWQPGEAILRWADLSAELGVSRSIIHEAFRILGANGLIRSRTSDVTRVLPQDRWRLLDPDVMDWRIRAGDTP